MPWYAFLLAPFALIFLGITTARNFLYDRGWLKSYRSPIPTIVVGNLSVGGTGKTPMVEFLVNAFHKEKKLATLSRGYGRKSTGFFQANPESIPEQIGDEPLQVYSKFQGKIPVFVGEDRVASLQKIHNLHPKPDWVILDDAFQHRKLLADFYILLTPFSKPFYSDWILPMGRLRETGSGAKRADVVIVTKCPEDLRPSKKEEIRKGLKTFLRPSTSVFFSKLTYGEPYSIHLNVPFSGKVMLVSGLADPSLFESYCRKTYRVFRSFSFPDHYRFSEKDWEKIGAAWTEFSSGNPVILCTEKDAQKLKVVANEGKFREIPIFALPMEVKLESQEKEMLIAQIRQKLGTQ
ncbi:tetraacyldisaccharide 4'-kinase [Algoriphagus confluentis]|uniref:Tetraacyldisaccharide 4'-kinase n=1 Tax=Algoriphagus confluentis TaxID=1697556 RepID=A0ABQ6PIL8_9BACT|nr:tetraacyldisaccharide 4'-kinase [Algoriphagus confluentis]